MNECYLPEVLQYLRQEVPVERTSFFKELESYAKDNLIPIVHLEVAKMLDHYVRLINPDNVLEIGTAIGYSALWLAKSFTGRGKIYTIEVSSPNIGVAAKNFEKYDHDKKIVQIEGDAKDFLPQDKHEYELIFVDAKKKQYAQYLELCLPLLKKDGVIIFDNLFWHGQVPGAAPVSDRWQKAVPELRQFNKLFINHDQLDSVILPVGDGLGVGIKNV